MVPRSPTQRSAAAVHLQVRSGAKTLLRKALALGLGSGLGSGLGAWYESHPNALPVIWRRVLARLMVQ